MNLVITSCVSEEEPVATPVSDKQQALEDAKAWFGPREEFVIENDNSPLDRQKSRTKKIHWNKAITHEDEQVIELELDYSSHGVPVKGEKSPEQVKKKQDLAFFRLILDRNEEGGYKKYLVKYFPEQKIGIQSKLEVNNYKTLSKSFTGEVLRYDWDENLLMGWQIVQGQVVRFFRSRELHTY